MSAAFLDHPGRPGAFGALMDETARASEDLCALVEAMDEATWNEQHESDKPFTASRRAVGEHVVTAARWYADRIRERLGIEFEQEARRDALPTPAEFRGKLAGALRYTEGAIEPLLGKTEKEVTALTFDAGWGVTYDPEMILEHGVCHVLRHRRQLERWGR